MSYALHPFMRTGAQEVEKSARALICGLRTNETWEADMPRVVRSGLVSLDSGPALEGKHIAMVKPGAGDGRQIPLEGRRPCALDFRAPEK